MKQIIVSLLFLITIVSNGIAQNVLSNYSFVVVPERFGFQTEDFQFELNEMATFYLKNYGFNPFYLKDLPDVSNCDGLWFDANYHDTFASSFMSIVFRDCKGEEIYKVYGAKNKYKEYRKSYQAALRAAFDELKIAEVKQPTPILREDSKQEEMVSESVSIKSSVSNFAPENKFNSYVSNGVSYLLKKIESGYNVYESSNDSEDELLLKGSILKTENGFTGILFEKQYTCSFSENKDLLLVEKDGNSLLLKYQN